MNAENVLLILHVDRVVFTEWEQLRDFAFSMSRTRADLGVYSIVLTAVVTGQVVSTGAEVPHKSRSYS